MQGNGWRNNAKVKTLDIISETLIGYTIHVSRHKMDIIHSIHASSIGCIEKHLPERDADDVLSFRSFDLEMVVSPATKQEMSTETLYGLHHYHNIWNIRLGLPRPLIFLDICLSDNYRHNTLMIMDFHHGH